MGRPANGTKKHLPSGKVRAEFLKQPGAPERWRHTFADEAAADRWLADCRHAWSAGLATPDPRSYATFQLPKRARLSAVPPEQRTFAYAAHRWVDEYYEKQRRGGPGRKREVESYIRRHIQPYLDQCGAKLVADVDHEMFVDFASFLAGQHLRSAAGERSDPLDPVLVTRQELLRRSTKHKSTVQRALGSAVPVVARRDDGKPLYSLGAARREGLLGGEPLRGGLDKEYASDVLATLKRILVWAHGHGWTERLVGETIRSVKPDAAVELVRKGKKRPTRRTAVPLEVCAVVAQQLVFIDAVAMWVQRLLGTRLAETFGPVVGDLLDHGSYGILTLQAQGGRRFWIRDEHGNSVLVDRKEELKTAESVRVLVVPGKLMELLRILIEIFHTDDQGVVDLSARLIPGRRTRNAGGSQAYAANLKGAFAAGGDPSVGTDNVSSHDLRASLATDLRWSPAELSEFAQKRYLGHRGEDVHDRFYVLDHPSMAPQLRIADAIDQEIAEHIGHLLLRYAPMRWTKDNAFYDQRHEIDQALRSYGLLADQDQMTTGQLAEHLEVGQTTVRRWLREGQIEGATRIEGHGPVHYQAAAGAVKAHLEAPAFEGQPLDAVAADLGMTYHQARRLLLDVGHGGERRADGKFDLSDAAVAAMRRERDRVQALHQRAVKHAEAARRLGCSRRSISDRIARGELELDAETDTSGAQFVTLESIEAVNGRGTATDGDWLSLDDVCSITGFRATELLGLLRAGHLEQRAGRATVAISRRSLVQWATGYRPDLLAKLGARHLRAIEALGSEVGRRTA